MNAAAEDGKASFVACLSYRQTWAFAIGQAADRRCLVVLPFLDALPISALSITSNHRIPRASSLFSCFMRSRCVSIIGGWLPTFFVEKKGMNAYAGRMKAMLIFAFFPLLALARPSHSAPIATGGRSSSSASPVPRTKHGLRTCFPPSADMFPKKAIATITGIGGMAGGIGAFAVNKSSGLLFDYAAKSKLTFMGFHGEEAGYFIIFLVLRRSLPRRMGRSMRALVPHYKPITDL